MADPVPAKSWYLSKTVIINVLTAVVAVATTLSSHSIVAENPRLAAGLAAVVSIVNIGLRFITFTRIA